MKGVIDMDEINFFVIIKGVGCSMEEEKHASNTGVVNKISKRKTWSVRRHFRFHGVIL